MVSNELIRQIVKEMTNAFEYLLQTIGRTMGNLKKAISDEKLEKCLPHEQTFDQLIRQMQINMDIVNAMMEKVTASGDDVRRLQATAKAFFSAIVSCSGVRPTAKRREKKDIASKGAKSLTLWLKAFTKW